MKPAFHKAFRPFVAVAVLLSALGATAQRPAHFEHADADLVHAMELFAKAKYGAAQYELERVVERVTDPQAPVRAEAEYHAALCAVRLFHDDAGHRLRSFLAAHPGNQHAPAVRFELLKHAFSQRKWKDVIAWSEQVDRFGLDADELEEYRFKRGYAFFQQEDRNRALGEFAEVKDGSGTYASPALYYASHIHYERGEHETALQGFQRLKGDESFGRVVPLYIAEILFLQGKYDELDAYVKPLLEDPQGTKRIEEVHRLAGEANYRRGRYTEALPHLEKSARRAGVGREDRYILGYTHARTGDCRKALAELNIVSNGTDSLAQLAAYHIAGCHLELNEKNHARNAFKRAHELGNDAKVSEDALFQYAKLAYELSFDPYHEAINALRNYLRDYPDTPRRDEAYEFLLNVYLRTRNYEAALDALDGIKVKDLRLQEAYQKLAYNRGVELYEGRKYADAALFFERALKHPVDQRVNAQAHFWMAESYYGKGDLTAALRKYEELRASPGSYSTDLYEQAGYGMGYALFKLKRYGEAAAAFRRYTASERAETRQRMDALTRTGDCHFMTGENEQAVRWYDEAIRANAPDRDYAMFQKGLCQGLLGQHTAKLATLKALLNEKPDTRYADDARFQLAETCINLNNDAEAMRYYREVLAQHPNSPHVRQSMLQVGLIHKRQGDTERALEQFKAVVEKYPTMDDAKNALAGIEAIYVEQGRVAEYGTYLESLKFVDRSTINLDTTYYRSAEGLYFAGKCPEAINALSDYLGRYPNGAFALNALFYRGDCAYRTGRFEQALPDLEEVVRRDAAQFLETAHFGVSDILFREKRWEGALDHFRRLEQVASFPRNVLAGQVGQMRCLHELGRTADASAAAKRVLDNPGVTPELRAEAGLVLAKGLLDNGEHDAAYERFKAVSAASTGAEGAEAGYHQAYVRHLQGRFKDVETEVFAFAQRYPAHERWKDRAFILLGDAYARLGDNFQAKAALRSVIANSREPDLVEQARQRLAAIEKGQAPQQPPPGTEEDIEIELPGGRE